MSALTKIFVVLLVVVSLLSAAGFIVFVNQVENFKTSLTDVRGRLSLSESAVTAANTATQAAKADVRQARMELDRANQQITTVTNDRDEKVASLNTTIAGDKSQAAIAAVSLSNVSAALNTSEATRKGLNDSLTAARTETDKLNTTLLQDETAISDYTNKVDVLQHQVTNFTEELAQAQAENTRLHTLLKSLGASDNGGTATGPNVSPAINGVVTDTRTFNGIEYATISVGSAEQVAKGMVFQVIDRAHAKFLGELTIDSVDLHSATGKLVGPNLASVSKSGTTEVKTQL